MGSHRRTGPVGYAEFVTGRVGIHLGGDGEDGTTVVLGDATCPQAVSTDGGRVRVPPGLGQELQGLVESTSD